MKPKSLLTVPQAAEKLAVSERTVGRMYRSGEIPHVKVRGQVRIDANDIDRYIENHYYTEAV
ncbi:hypothetical protein Rrhod_0569 [Rhodococcus rhodnii LMG 5362]|uniref:Helix-turn-helix domain-containing protein n=1 Tax=Rhodococcus rhodnii LMG 5362 TaxID=1273125 RepID=R7WRT4_9NOCA|nr:helix-turn-helix domain-containing protein [Rhodococcus rhodnii]EOM78028.1 hypothetical protein Rrhod_0569 [Rhodococcus rhodnii LMG 5362]